MANKLELTWYGKDEPIQVEPRILIERPELSNTAADPETGNMLIHGDNLLALKALEKKYAGKVKCVYIDPPYNTGSAFEHYDDNTEHSKWLNLMRPRLEILLKLLSVDGSMWISIDDGEQAYLKALCDEVFGRCNFVCNVIWEKKGTRSNDARWFSDTHDFILVYAKDKSRWRPNLLPRPEDSAKGYTNPDNDKRGVWASGPCHAKTPNEKDIYPIEGPNGKIFMPPPGTSWRFSKEKFIELIKDKRIWFGEDGNNVPRYKRFLTEVKDGFVPKTLWGREEVGDNQEAKKEVKTFNAEDVFATPKPERLIQKILILGSKPGDLILDSFLGSGTTAGTAHKMGRKWIGIEMGEHAYTHCKIRLDKVIAGEHPGKVTQSTNWQGGGGYRFYELAPTLINEDAFGEPVINHEYDADMLAAAVALHEGFTYQPDKETFWKQSAGTEKSYLYVTTQHLTEAYLNFIEDAMAEDEYLVIACSSYDRGLEKRHRHVTIKKIPQMLLGRCKFGDVNYNLNIIHPPVYEDEDEEDYEDD